MHEAYGDKAPESNESNDINMKDKFSSGLASLVFGKPEIAAHGLMSAMGMRTEDEHCNFMSRVQMMTEGLEVEIEAFGHPNLIVYKDYILYEIAQSHTRLPGCKKMQDVGHEGMTFDDFCSHPCVLGAHLLPVHVFALRFYTTNAYPFLNAPMREQSGNYHPLPATMYYVAEGLKRLRAVFTHHGTAGAQEVQPFWRGLHSRIIPDSFFKDGGTELACMSATNSKSVAYNFSQSGKCPILFEFVPGSFMECAPMINFLSLYPEENEALFPPLTYIEPIDCKMLHLTSGNKKKGKVASVPTIICSIHCA